MSDESLEKFVEVFTDSLIRIVNKNDFHGSREELKEIAIEKALEKSSPLIKRKMDEQKKFLSHVRLDREGENPIPHTQDAKDGAYLFRRISSVMDERVPNDNARPKRRKHKTGTPFDLYRMYVDTFDVIPPDAHMEMAMGTVSASSYSKYRQVFKEEGYVFETIPMKWDKSLNRWWHVVERPKAKMDGMIEDIAEILKKKPQDTVKAIWELLEDSDKDKE